MNRLSDAWLLDQAALVVERTLGEDNEGWSWGCRSEFYMGADAALLHPLDGFGPSRTPRFGTDFRQAYFSLHAPVLTEGESTSSSAGNTCRLAMRRRWRPTPMYSELRLDLFAERRDHWRDRDRSR